MILLVLLGYIFEVVFGGPWLNVAKFVGNRVDRPGANQHVRIRRFGGLFFLWAIHRRSSHYRIQCWVIKNLTNNYFSNLAPI